MKKAIAVLLSLILVLCFVSCDGSVKAPEESNGGSTNTPSNKPSIDIPTAPIDSKVPDSSKFVDLGGEDVSGILSVFEAFFSNEKRTISTLLKKSKYIICDNCYLKYHINISVASIPLNRFELYIYSLFDKNYRINPLAYSYEYSRLFNYVYYNDKDSLIFSFDKLRLNSTILAIFNDLSTFYAKNICVICNCLLDWVIIFGTINKKNSWKWFIIKVY